MTWQPTETIISKGKITQYKILENGQIMSLAQVLDRWKNEEQFCHFFTQLLANSPFQAFFWEAKSATLDQLNQDFEFVLVNSPSLAKIRADRSAFQPYFAPNQPVVVFTNLGGDATLVVPTPLPQTDYPHLAHFLRHAPETQTTALWQQVSDAYQAKLSHKRLWLSTSGLGVYWLHIRLDDRPKYYQYGGYK
jgi:hypothetical protein